MMPRLRAFADVLLGLLHVRQVGVRVRLGLVAVGIGELERRSGERAQRAEGLRAVAEFKVEKCALPKFGEALFDSARVLVERRGRSAQARVWLPRAARRRKCRDMARMRMAIARKRPRALERAGLERNAVQSSSLGAASKKRQNTESRAVLFSRVKAMHSGKPSG